ncbi:MmcQ/YjbR family DNA-binding protein [Mucilaginibacter glaciei]|uniref:MmcQ/YjbR family DNA-binding protein n=1 Tax=Mucilaginibacter glaciei TaxID=2772109 RepID=A0A926NM78_9SPHI|nr:MmcQ/YjbR family DNA-binding protein [Mucilaginibacter glaciei]MBD1391788.1 MmcQ/YjbR family DNA-binding protein [Mucilaginibacter glaciei]
MFDILRQIALSLPEVTEEPHFHKTSFRVAKKIFATIVPNEGHATVKLSPAEQDVFCTFDANVVYPVPNKWGQQGWTHVNLVTIEEKMLVAVLKSAYKEVAPKKLGDLIKFDEA